MAGEKWTEGAYLVVSKDHGAAVNLLCFAGWSIAVALKSKFSHALGFGGGSYSWILFFIVVVLLLGGRDGFRDTDRGGDGSEGKKAKDHVLKGIHLIEMDQLLFWSTFGIPGWSVSDDIGQ